MLNRFVGRFDGVFGLAALFGRFGGYVLDGSCGMFGSKNSKVKPANI